MWGILLLLTVASKWDLLSSLMASSCSLAWSLHLAACEAPSPMWLRRERRQVAWARMTQIETLRRFCWSKMLCSYAEIGLPCILWILMHFSAVRSTNSWWTSAEASPNCPKTRQSISPNSLSLLSRGPTEPSWAPQYFWSIYLVKKPVFLGKCQN